MAILYEMWGQHLLDCCSRWECATFLFLWIFCFILLLFFFFDGLNWTRLFWIFERFVKTKPEIQFNWYFINVIDTNESNGKAIARLITKKLGSSRFFLLLSDLKKMLRWRKGRKMKDRRKSRQWKRRRSKKEGK